MTTTTPTGQFADEETPSSTGYPAGYAVKPVVEQITALAALLNLDPRQAIAYLIAHRWNGLPDLPIGTDWFAIPSPLSAVSVDIVIAKLASSRHFSNSCKGQLGPDRLRRSARTAACLAEIAQQQPGDILIVPAQLGLSYRGKSVRRARELFTDSEFGFGLPEAGSVLLTHPERLVTHKDLFMDLPGDEYNFSGDDGNFSYAPIFSVVGDKLGLCSSEVSGVDGEGGSVSGFNLAA